MSFNWTGFHFSQTVKGNGPFIGKTCNKMTLTICYTDELWLTQGSNSTGEKTGKMMKSNYRPGKHRKFKYFGKTQGNS